MNLSKEILSVCRRIRRANKSSKGLLDVFQKEDESICLIIKRNQDGRIQVLFQHCFEISDFRGTDFFISISGFLFLMTFRLLLILRLMGEKFGLMLSCFIFTKHLSKATTPNPIDWVP